MKKVTIEERIERHHRFWNHENSRPLVIMWPDNLFYSTQFQATRKMLAHPQKVDAADIRPEEYLPDYEKQYHEFYDYPQDGIYTAEPCQAFPWMECIFGGQAFSENGSIATRPVCAGIREMDGFSLHKEDNPWYQKYIEFSRILTEFAEDRFSVSQPILRGVSDTLGSLVGPTQMIYNMMDDEELVASAFRTVAEGQRELIADQYKVTRPFRGGYSFGLYRVWAPGKVMWFQEDLSALLSPDMFEEFLVETSERIIAGYDYTMMHLHSNAFRHLDLVCGLKDLAVVQLNKDLMGPPVREMIPACRQVLEAGKRVFLGMSEMSREDIDAVYEGLPHRGIVLNIVPEGRKDAEQIMEYICSKNW